MRRARLTPLRASGASVVTDAEQAASPEFRVDVAPERELVRVCPVGEVDLGTAERLEAVIKELVAAGFAGLVLDLRETTFLDSTGLRLVLGAHARSAEDGWSFAIVPGSRDVQRAFDVAGLTERLPFVAPSAYRQAVA